ncbi:MAG: hypothetical protein V8R40_13670 [Dysosmobacter sp.]
MIADGHGDLYAESAARCWQGGVRLPGPPWWRPPAVCKVTVQAKNAELFLPEAYRLAAASAPVPRPRGRGPSWCSAPPAAQFNTLSRCGAMCGRI